MKKVIIPLMTIVILALMEGGVWYERQFEDPKKPAEVPEQPQASPEAVAPIQEPKRQQPVQLSLFD